MKKVLFLLAVFASFSYVAAFDKAPVVELTAPFPDLISKNGKFFKIKKVGAKNEFPAVALSTSDFSDAIATTAIKRPVFMKDHTHFDFSSFMIPNAELSASSRIAYPYPSIINDGGAFFEKARSKNDAVGSTSASNADANDATLAATTLIKNIKTTDFSFAYKIDKVRLKNDAIYYTSVVTADKYAKPTIKTATIATKNEQFAKVYMHTDGKILSSSSSLIVTNDNAEIKNVAGKEIILVSISAYTSSVANIGNEHKPVAGSKIGTMVLGHSDYGA